MLLAFFDHFYSFALNKADRNDGDNQTQGLGLVSELESIGTLPRVRLKNYGKCVTRSKHDTYFA